MLTAFFQQTVSIHVLYTVMDVMYLNGNMHKLDKD